MDQTNFPLIDEGRMFFHSLQDMSVYEANLQAV